MPIAIVGDVHGEPRKLEKMLKILGELDRRIVFVGDYINRGSDSKSVIEMLGQFSQERQDAVFLWGNHEIAFLHYLKKGGFAEFARCGGLATLRSYLKDDVNDLYAEFLDAFPSHHRRFFTKLRRFYEDEEVLVSHLGIDPRFPNNRSYRALVLEPHPELFERKVEFDRMLVCGHYTRNDFAPYKGESFVCLDTGCGVGGPLTCLFSPEGEFISV